MKKVLIFTSILFICFTISVYALTENFSFDTSKLTFAENSKKDEIINSFNKQYYLKTTLSNNNQELENKIKELSKKTTYLILGDMNGIEESSENFYKRHQDYQNLAAYKYYHKDKNSKSGYDESKENYVYAVVSEFSIPQMFNAFNELGVVYNSYGDIRVTISDNLVISTVTLPNVKIKEQNKEEPMKYDLIKTNLIIYYYFLEIDNEYRLAYLYGETVDNVNKYFDELENTETKNSMALQSSYDSNLSAIYNFDKLNNMTDNKINQIYNSNISNIVYLSSFYNNKITSNANGFFINKGIVVTTWDFLEQSLINAQYITIKDSIGTNYNFDGIITANPDTNVAVLKLKEQNSSFVNLGDSTKVFIEDPAIIISSKSGVGLIIQKGIIISNDEYLQTSIPLSKVDQGSPLFDKDGNVIGMSSSKSVGASISLSINSNILREIQEKFEKENFDKIDTISFEKLKEEYYYIKYSSEDVINNIPKSKWKIYSKIGNIENTIKLDLMKASYEKGAVSLRYKNNISKYIDSMQLASTYRSQLLKDGYKELVSSSSKCVYSNKKYKVIIMAEFDYLIVIMVKL